MRFLILPILLLLTACAGQDPQGEKIGAVNQLYNEGLDQLQTGDTLEAIHTFNELQRQHPYSGWATKAQVMIVYAHYLNDDPIQTASAAQTFIRLHPGHDDLAYVYYLRGIAHYNQISDVNRDQGATRKAQESLAALLNRFPDSIYARDARLKQTLLDDHLAGKEMAVGRFYLEQDRYLAAIGRFKNVVKNYEQTNQIQEALYRLTEAYAALGLPEEAQKNAAVLGYNYPNSDWYERAYKLLTDNNWSPALENKPTGFLDKTVDKVKKIF